MTRGTVISVVTPVYNEKGSVEPLLADLVAVFESLPYEFELIIVNDGSDAVTTEILDRMCETDERVGVVHLSRNFGHQAALSAGLDEATGDAVLVMDSDLQHPPAVIPVLVREWESGHDVVHAVRRAVRSGSRTKRLASRAFYRLFNRASDTKIPVNGADFRLMDRQAVDAMKQLPERQRFVRGLSSWVGFRQTTVPYDEVPRRSGTPKYSMRKQIDLGVHGLVSMSTRPLRWLLALGGLLLVAGLAGGVFDGIATWSTGSSFEPIRLMLWGILSLAGLQLMGIGTLGLYVGAVYREVQGRPLYLVQRRSGAAVRRQIRLREAARR